jgi:hypothetical protein
MYVVGCSAGSLHLQQVQQPPLVQDTLHPQQQPWQVGMHEALQGFRVLPALKYWVSHPYLKLVGLAL